MLKLRLSRIETYFRKMLRCTSKFNIKCQTRQVLALSLREIRNLESGKFVLLEKMKEILFQKRLKYSEHTKSCDNDSQVFRSVI